MSLSKRLSLRQIVSYIFMAVALGLLVTAVARNWEEFAAAVGQLSPITVTCALGAGVVALGATLMAWRESVATTTGFLLPMGPAVHTFFVSQLGKYLPGAVWPVVAQMELMKRYDINRAQSATGSVLSMVVGLGSAVVVGTAGVFVAGVSLSDYWWLVLVATACAAVMSPPLLRQVVRRLSRLHLRFRSFETVTIDGRRLVTCAAWSMAAWIGWGLHAWLILDNLADIGFAGFPYALGAFALAWAVGFVIVIAPGGVGPREMALIALVGAVAGPADALALTIVTRVLMALLDVVLAALASTLSRVVAEKRRPAA